MPQNFSEPVNLVNSQNQFTITIDNESGTISFIDTGGKVRAVLNNKGELYMMDSHEGLTMKFESSKADLFIGTKFNPGKIFLKNDVSDSNCTVKLSGDTGSISLGSTNNAGSVDVKGPDGMTKIVLNGTTGKITITEAQDGFEANENGGIVSKFNNAEVLKFDAKTSTLFLGAFRTDGKNAIQLDGQTGNIVAKNNKIEVFRFDAEHAALYLGNKGEDGDLIIKDAQGKDRIRLDGAKGDIILRNADFAEDFDISARFFTEIEPGTVMVLNDEGKLQACESVYDKKVAGIVSGGGSYKPGIILDKHPELDNRLPIALSGKVWCKVDAHFGPIEVGDLLTTSSTLGHAMKAQNIADAFGSVIGKALAPVKEGIGFIPVLVSLQ
jgi:hypothetical protein